MGRFGEYDVVVIGAGFAGLGAARALVRAGFTVRVLEARPRVGGRVLTRYLPDGTQLDLGGQWIGPTQPHMAELIDHYGIRTYPTPEEGEVVVDHDGRRLTEMPAQAWEIFDELDTLARQVRVEQPWTGPHAEQWDWWTVAAWLEGKRVAPEVARFVDRVVCGGMFASSAAEISLLQTLFQIAGAGGVRRLLGDRDTAQDLRIVGGVQYIAERMAADLPPGTLRLAEPVVGIEYDTTARVHTPTSRYHAARVVVAVPPMLAARIRYDPPLPPLWEGLFQRMPAGTALKVHAVYADPFWRADGLSGVAHCTTGVLTETADNTPPGPHRAVLTGFVYGTQAVALRRETSKARRTAVLDHLAALFGDQTRQAEDFVEFDWLDQEWTRGGFAAYLAPGAWSTFGPNLRKPVGPLHWAGTETAVRWNGYCDGAVESGNRAAEEIRHALSH